MRELSGEELGRRRVFEYRKNLRGIARAFWNGTIDFDQFYELMMDNIRLGLRDIWYAGASICNIAPAELSPEERAELERAVYSENNHLFGLADFIEQNSKSEGGKFQIVLDRISLWGNRGLDVYNKAKVMACGDEKLMWVMDPAKEHCDSCARLHGKVKRASYWKKSGVHPQDPPNPFLLCGGWECGCGLVQTDKPLSRGPLPKLP